ncbi:imelysin family protein [Marinobacter oulmenensis]|uniref:Imelysin-like domain-containing protein n=1 Tax=Marinobacter oulmenensis TaxID=643747 RepID=A0A840UMZ8_9GAMM|nr:imelysin family protein [Marinobacter oulmenensis]MBB5322028.1 hypothetical protein [Marinobacter oulmenensis]
MKPFSRLLCISAALLALNASAAAETPAQQARQQWHQEILTGYEHLAEQAGAFADAAGSWCSSPSEQGRTTTEKAWREAFMAWQAVRFVNFGPIETDNRSWQFQFWPDPKNLIARKARYLLSSDEPATAGTIDDSGVAVQGFPMAEYLLFDQPFNQGERALPAGRSCDLLVLVAGHIRDTADQQLRDWQAFRAPYLANDQYHDTTIKAGMTALEVLEERRLAQPMGLRGNGKRSVYAADAWRSGTSLATLEATVRGLKQHFLPGLTLLLENGNQPELAPRIRSQFDEVLENFPDMDKPMAPLLAEDGHYSELQGLFVDVSQLTTLVNDQAAVALGVVRGFNSSDGD